MSEHVSALLVHEHPESFEFLKLSLKYLSIETYSAANYQQAANMISQLKPDIIFLEGSLGDGWWWNILDIANSANVPLSAIVVSAYPDTRLYLSAMDRGAFDFVAPPFEREPLEFVTRSAAINTRRRREAAARAAAVSMNLEIPPAAISGIASVAKAQKMIGA